MDTWSIIIITYICFINVAFHVSSAEGKVSHGPRQHSKSPFAPFVQEQQYHSTDKAKSPRNIRKKSRGSGQLKVKTASAPEPYQAIGVGSSEGLLKGHPNGKPKRNIFCYYGSSANTRPSLGKFWPEDIDPYLCTHLIFAFVDITKDGTGIKPNNNNDLGEEGLYARTIRLKEKNPDLKILLAAGGWKIGSKPFLPVIASESTWRTWISNVIIYLRQYKFDGFDMDWEFPGWRGSGPEDKQKFTLLMRDLQNAFREEASATGRDKLLLTMATASSSFYAEVSYEQAEIHKHIDFMLLMTYNYHGSGWEKETGHHSPMLPHRTDPEGEKRENNILWSIEYWLNFGVPREKIILGLPTYGLGWKLTDLSNTGIKAPADGGNTKGKYSEESGILSHYEICEHILQDGWKVEWIEDQKVPYAHGGGEWVGFDSPDSFYLKAKLILQMGLGGAFIWSVEMDDFRGHCGGPKYPLLRTVYDVFTRASGNQLAEIKSPSLPPSSSAAASARHPPTLHLHTHNAPAHASHPKSDKSQAKVSEQATSHHSDQVSSHHTAEVSSGSGHDKGHSSSDGTHHSKDHSHDEYPSYYTYDDDTSDHIEDVDCGHLGLGIHSDPHSCHHFILCMPKTIHTLGPTRMVCPAGTLYDPKYKVCNHEHEVYCPVE